MQMYYISNMEKKVLFKKVAGYLAILVTGIAVGYFGDHIIESSRTENVVAEQPATEIVCEPIEFETHVEFDCTRVEIENN